MTTVNYDTMSDRELKSYILTHRNDLQAFQAYMDRRRESPSKTLMEFDDPDWEKKVVSVIQVQLDSDRRIGEIPDSA